MISIIITRLKQTNCNILYCQKNCQKKLCQFQSSSEARCLANQVELYYSRPSDSRLELMTKFTKAPTLFSHDDLIKEVNNIQIVDAETTQEAEVKNWELLIYTLVIQ